MLPSTRKHLLIASSDHIYDRIGCQYNMPHTVSNNTFEQCYADVGLPVGIYTDSAGNLETYTQPPESLGAITTIPYEPVTPSSSNCSSPTAPPAAVRSRNRYCACLTLCHSSSFLQPQQNQPYQSLPMLRSLLSLVALFDGLVTGCKVWLGHFTDFSGMAYSVMELAYAYNEASSSTIVQLLLPLRSQHLPSELKDSNMISSSSLYITTVPDSQIVSKCDVLCLVMPSLSSTTLARRRLIRLRLHHTPRPILQRRQRLTRLDPACPPSVVVVVIW